MKRIIKLTAFILALTMLIGSALAVGETDGEFGDELTEAQYEFIYNPEHYEMKFSTLGVFVVLKRGLTAEDVDFSEIDYNRIQKEPVINGSVEADNLVLFMVLSDRTVNGVLSAISLLKDNPGVLYAEPIYRNYWTGTDVGTGSSTGSSTTGSGDINYDGKRSNNDVIILARYIVRLTSLTYNQLERADLNGDRKVNNTDLILLAKKVVGL